MGREGFSNKGEVGRPSESDAASAGSGNHRMDVKAFIK